MQEVVDTNTAVQLFLATKRNAGRAPSTVATYDYTLRPLADRFSTIPRDPDLLARFLKDHGGRGDVSLANAYRRVGTFYRWLIRRKFLDASQNPFAVMEAPIVKRQVPRILSLGQLQRVVEASRPPFERALILVFVDAGPRVGELVGRTRDDIVGDALRVTGKTAAGRLVPISPKVREYLEALPTHNLFPKRAKFGDRTVVDAPANVRSLQAATRRVIKRAGITGPKLGPHLLRHSFATAFVESGGDLVTLKEILGHTTTRMTEKYVTLAQGTIQAKQAMHSPLRAMKQTRPATPRERLPKTRLPLEASLPLSCKDGPIFLTFVADRRANGAGQRIFYYIRARAGPKRWPVSSLGTDLPLMVVDAYRYAVHEENQRRLEALGRE